MKKVFVALLMALSAACLLPAQGLPVGSVPVVAGLTGMSAGGGFCPDILGKPISTHYFGYSTHFAPSVLLITITTSTGGAFTTNTTANTVAGGTITISGTYTGICFTVTTLTGTNASVDGAYYGPPIGGSNGAVNVPAGGIAASAFAAGSAPDGAIPALGNRTDDRCQTTDANSCAVIPLDKQTNYWLSLIASGTATSSVTDPCLGLKTTGVDYYIASTTLQVMIPALSGSKNNVCSGFIKVGTAAGEIVSYVEGTGTRCGTGTAIVWGGDTTASHGAAFGADGGIAAVRFNGKTANVDTCLRTSGSNPVTVHIEYVQAP